MMIKNKKKKKAKSISFNGEKYYLWGKCYYSKTLTPLHRAIWIFHNGVEIPDGYCIHHRDENPFHNEIENLECMSKSDHSKLHFTPEKRKLFSEVSKEHWFSTDEGVNRRTKKVCKCCGKQFIGTTRSKYCSSSCGHKYRYKLRAWNMLQTKLI